MHEVRWRPTSARTRSRPVGLVFVALLLACAALEAPDAAARPGKRPATDGGSSPQTTAADRTGPQLAVADQTRPRETATDQIQVDDAAMLGPEAALRAVALIGVPYRWGGKLPATGLDCSGLVHHVFGEIGLVTPRDTRGLSRTGASIARNGLQPGDLVFFNTLRRAYSHVGIYLGNDRFVHAPSAGADVRIESMNARYWRERYDGARRLGPAEEAVSAGTNRRAWSTSSESSKPVRLESVNVVDSTAVARTEATGSFYQY